MPARRTSPATESNTTRDTIVAVADRLFYEHGFAHTSFSDIAEAVGISRGNFYYHFKSKDEILKAAVAARMQATRNMLETWEAKSSLPADRILCYIRIVVTNRSKIMLHGCPVGTLTGELAKLGHPARVDASAVFIMFREWLGTQFKLLGRESDADALAMYVLAFSQGIAVMDNAFRDKAFVEREVARMTDWLAGLSAQSPTVDT